MPGLCGQRRISPGLAGQFVGSGRLAGSSLRSMSHLRRPVINSRAWQRTTAGGLDPLPAAPAAAPAGGPPRARVQPPLQEVLQGLDARELEGQTVFDQLFGPKPEGDPRLLPR